MRRDVDAEFTTFVEARRPALRRFAYALCGDWHRADDLVQTALVRTYLAWGRLHTQGAEESYVRRAVLTSHVDEGRRPWRRERTPLDGHDRSVHDPAPEDRSALVEVLQTLPVMQRQVVVLRYLLDLSVEETAAELGISPGTVKSHASRGRDRLREVLSPSRS
ncbi:SigE family RNA polymerase sigma factor [Nocardioides marmoribigeumensis]|uniref:RNA polymerase sigma-70 factor (Sigma-E family) n=1 Tax=Nocardioides marmoribigeumensis TaxID=433649 RepID=A0ABU2BVK4_9ACTN|nr:SigE family RNA polymerase sigma factor [Nocardioides marmoribigeumensis]MDR7362664.1 RNA polymerase sigma-70 factor (sigma-E family) [Nocardioides marmoribigeumensis]